GGSGDDAEPVVAEAGDGEVAFDAAVLVEQLGVGQGPDRACDTVVGKLLQEVRRAAAADLDLGERGEVEDRRRLAARTMLDSDRRRPQPPRPAAGPQRLVALCAVGLEPVDALPTRLLAERRSELFEARVERRDPKRPPRAALVPGVLDVVVGRV